MSGQARRPVRPLLAPSVTPPVGAGGIAQAAVGGRFGPPGDGTCRRCLGPANSPFDSCWSCSLVTRRLGLDSAVPVRPISLIRPDCSLHRVLVAYKSSPDACVRRACSAALARLIATYISIHNACLARAGGGGWDCVTVVPSTRRSCTLHPLSAALAATPALASRHESLLVRGASPIGHLMPDSRAYQALPAAERRRVLLLDDVYTTGARALSAVSALERAGATVVTVLVVGRMVHPEAVPSRETWWRERVAAGEAVPPGSGGEGARRSRSSAQGNSTRAGAWASCAQASSFAWNISSTCCSADCVALPSTSRRSSVSTECAARR